MTLPFSSHTVSFREALVVWMRVAVLSFGGPAGQIAVMHRILVEEKRWISESRFLHALNYCMLLPGPEAQQLATYVGWLLHRTPGGLVAGTLFVLPGFLSILALSLMYATMHHIAFVAGLFFGLKPAVMVVVVEAVVRIGRRALKNSIMVGLAAAAFVALFFFAVPFPSVVGVAAAIGLAGGALWPNAFVVIRPPQPGDESDGAQYVIGDDVAAAARPSLARITRVLTVWSTLWFAPIALLAMAMGIESVFVQEGIFFSKAAVVTFGGAYSVLAYIAQQAVETYGWLAPGEMLDGLGMAETTPGPLIQVVQFVGFMGAYRNPGALSPVAAGVLGSVVTTWVTFVPCFLWIFLGAPYIEYLRGWRVLSAALSAITAAVVGVVLNLAVWFALHVLFAEVAEHWFGPVRLWIPTFSTLDVASLVLACAAAVAMFRYRAGMITTLAVCAAAGALWRVAIGG